MSKVCPISGEKVLYLDCLECDTKECKKPLSFNSGISTKLRIDQKIYFIFGDVKDEVIFQARVLNIHVTANGNVYNFDRVKLSHERIKGTMTKYKKHGFCKDCNVDTGKAMGDVVVFTSKLATEQYIRKNRGKKSV